LLRRHGRIPILASRLATYVLTDTMKVSLGEGQPRNARTIANCLIVLALCVIAGEDVRINLDAKHGRRR
jgi:hypothetical protein